MLARVIAAVVVVGFLAGCATGGNGSGVAATDRVPIDHWRPSYVPDAPNPEDDENANAGFDVFAFRSY